MLAPAAVGEIQLLPPFNDPLAFDGLEQVSHVWLIFLFHQAMAAPGSVPRMRVRPPRLGGNSKLGVFATRSSHRPNAIGQSLVKIEHIQTDTLLVSGVDLLDQTPIIDIKPYVPYADSIDTAWNHIAATDRQTADCLDRTVPQPGSQTGLSTALPRTPIRHPAVGH